MNQHTIIFDIEASSTDTSKAIPRMIGWWSSITEDFHWTTDLGEFQAALDKHGFMVGWNHEDYDVPVLKRYNVSFYGLRSIDLMKIIHGKGFGNDLGRKGIITLRDGTHLGTVLHGKSLAEATVAFDVTRKVGDFDYNLFKRPFSELSDSEQEEAIDYLKHDILGTTEIYQYLEEYFEDFREGGVELPPEFFESVKSYYGHELDGPWRPFMTDEDKATKHYLTASTASMVYTMICNICGIEKEFGSAEHMSYGGGFVAEPSKASVEGNIYCFDYNSLYPHIMMQANLYGVNCTYQAHANEKGMATFTNVQGEGWKGEGISETVGYYRDDIQSPVSMLLSFFYKLRKKYKKDGSAKEYTIKIAINTIYGLLGNPSFRSVSNLAAANDCTALGRQWVKAARAKLSECGYDVIYTDTDSVYVRDVYNDEERIKKVIKDHIEEVKASVPFPEESFEMGIDDRIKFMMFVDDGKGSFKKKNYLYVTNEGKLKLKGLPLMKSNATPLGRHIFDKFIKPEILYNNRGLGPQRHLFSRSQIEKWIQDALDEDLGLMAVFHKVKAPEEYNSTTNLKYQLAIHPEYGEGSHHIVKLKAAHPRGAGAQRNYVSVAFKDEIKMHQIDLDKVWNELAPFIKPVQGGLGAFF